MKIEIKLENITINTKEELFQLLNEIDYVPSVFEGFSKITNRGDSLHWDLLEFIKDHFSDIIGLRSKEPDLLERFSEFVEFMDNKKIQLHESHEILKTYHTA